MSKIEVNAIEPQCGTTLTVGAVGTTVTVPSNVVKSNALQASDAGNIISQSGTTITLGASGDSINLASGATQSGFGRTGTVDWQTTPKTTGTFTAVSGEGYFLNTSGGVITANLPAGVAGAIVSFADYAATWQTNNVTVAPNGTDKIGSVNQNAILNVQGQSVTFVFVDSTQGWINTMDSTSNVRGTPPYIAATGGTILTCGNFKTHVFTGPGTFTVTTAAVCAADNAVEYLVVAGGGGGGSAGPGSPGGGGAGAGGWRSYSALACASPLNAPAGITVSAQAYPIVIGGGGATGGVDAPGSSGSNTTALGLTSTAGGFGAQTSPTNGGPGGSGGGTGGRPAATAGNGNTPPVSPSQGFPGGSTPTGVNAGGGGGAAAAGQNAPGPNAGGGGDGSFVVDGFIGPTAPSYGTTGPVGSTRYFAGGGGGGAPLLLAGTGGAGGGGGGNNPTAATINTGGGGSGNWNSIGGNGASGIVMIRYKFQ